MYLPEILKQRLEMHNSAEKGNSFATENVNFMSKMD